MTDFFPRLKTGNRKFSVRESTGIFWGSTENFLYRVFFRGGGGVQQEIFCTGIFVYINSAKSIQMVYKIYFAMFLTMFLVGVKGETLDSENAALIASCNTVVEYTHNDVHPKLRCVPKEELKTMYNNLPCPVWGCTVTTATNYNPTATTDDGSCTGCTDSATFADAWGVPCTDWDSAYRAGETCAEAATRWGYTTDQVDEVVAACPQMCGGCT